MKRTPGRILSLDVGDVRIGVALSDAIGMLASPLTIVERTDEENDVETILNLARERGAAMVLVGVPFSMDGTLGSQAVKVQAFIDALKKRSPVPVEIRDERLTTVEAMRRKQESLGGKRDKRKRPRYDAMAAAVILQDYLDEKRPDERAGVETME